MCASVGFVQPIRDVVGSYRRMGWNWDGKSEVVFRGFHGDNLGLSCLAFNHVSVVEGIIS